MAQVHLRGFEMFHARPDECHASHIAASRSVKDDAKAGKKSDAVGDGMIHTVPELADRAPSSRRTPRHSLIVVLPENHVVSPDRLTESLRGRVDQDVDVLVACAGQPTNLSALQRSVGDAQFLLAPAGTSPEELRELAIRQAPGDIVRLLSGARLDDSQQTERELFMTS
jgi:hypothetical protein